MFLVSLNSCFAKYTIWISNWFEFNMDRMTNSTSKWLLAKRFETYLKQIKDSTVEKLAILRNNKVEAVIISKDKYESMIESLKESNAQKILYSIKMD